MTPFGDRAFRFPIAPGVDRRALLATLRARPGVIDVVLAETTGLVVASAPVAFTAPAGGDAVNAPPHTLAVVYDGADLDALPLARDTVIALHAAPTYEVAMVGFQPGFAYLRGLDPRLVVPRRASPRPRVPARSVALAAGYTGIYPFASPGGWHLVGTAPTFAPLTAAGATLGLGDRVRFVPTDARDLSPAPLPRRDGGPAGADDRPWLEVKAARGPALLVDGGRVGHMHEGVPHGGALVRRGLARANEAAGNAGGACAVELYGDLEVVAHGDVRVATDDGAAHALGDGASLRIGTEGRTRVRYLAVRGGIDVPLVMGSRSTILAAGLGGLDGRALKRGDRLVVDGTSTTSLALPDDDDALVLLPGPDATREELAAIAAATFTLSPVSDRTGSRLEGPSLPDVPARHGRDRASVPMMRGAVERTPSGLVVLGPDHPTTGGYPVVAVLADRSHDAFFARVPGQPSRFVLARE